MKKPATAAGFPRRFDPFRVLPEEERRHHLERYASYLETRNGEIDLRGRRLSRREAYFAALTASSIRSTTCIDPWAFNEWLSGRSRPTLDERALLLVIVGKVNESERYGVDLELDRWERRQDHGADRRQLHVFLEEGYHSRILVEICRTCGVDLTPRTPPWSTRWLIQAVRYLPEWIRWIPVLCGEAVGCAVFKLLIDRCHAFADEPEVETRIRALLNEIWIDEVTHVAFVRARLSPRAIRLSKRMLPIVARSLTRDVPALGALDCSVDDLLACVRAGVELPSQLAWIEP